MKYLTVAKFEMTTMEYGEVDPPAPVSDWIHRFWYLRGGDGKGPVQPVVPDGRAEIVLHLGEAFGHVDEHGVVRRQAQVLVSGQLTRPQHLLPSADADIIGLRLTAAGAGALLGVPMHELTDSIVPLSEVDPRLAGWLLEAVVRPASRKDRFAALVNELGRRAPRNPAPLMQSVVRHLEDNHRVESLAKRLGVTPRTLQRQFAEQVGVSPKVYARVARFRRAYQALTGDSPPPPARVAALAGYFDQAHLIRDFRQFTGESPGRFFQTPSELASAFLATETDA